jgi:hypothetical protein
VRAAVPPLVGELRGVWCVEGGVGALSGITGGASTMRCSWWCFSCCCCCCRSCSWKCSCCCCCCCCRDVDLGGVEAGREA